MRAARRDRARRRRTPAAPPLRRGGARRARLDPRARRDPADPRPPARPHATRSSPANAAGARRAAARLHEIPVIVRELDDAETFEIALLENIQRHDLNAIEEAEAYQRLIDDFGHTQEALAKLVRKSRSHIANLLRLLDLPERARHWWSTGDRPGPCPGADGAPTIRARSRTEVVAEGLSVRETEALARASPRRETADAARRRARCRHRRARTPARRRARPEGGLKIAGANGGDADGRLFDARPARPAVPALLEAATRSKR